MKNGRTSRHSIMLPAVIPAKAEIQVCCRPAGFAWIPAFAGMTDVGERFVLAIVP